MSNIQTPKTSPSGSNGRNSSQRIITPPPKLAKSSPNDYQPQNKQIFTSPQKYVSSPMPAGNNPFTFYGKLILTCSLGNDPRTLYLYLQKGGDPNYIDFQGYTPLYIAVKYSFEKCVEILLDNGALMSMETEKLKSGKWRKREIKKRVVEPVESSEDGESSSFNSRSRINNNNNNRQNLDDDENDEDEVAEIRESPLEYVCRRDNTVDEESSSILNKMLIRLQWLDQNNGFQRAKTVGPDEETEEVKAIEKRRMVTAKRKSNSNGNNGSREIEEEEEEEDFGKNSHLNRKNNSSVNNRYGMNSKSNYNNRNKDKEKDVDDEEDEVYVVEGEDDEVTPRSGKRQKTNN
eukprot:TRINITY_DN27596_c0_g1_i1.p1 TRINITY_DN27596_c0_g1~~TRINITY_DN27596_c0_g1_i1.p1  ORF type:complete len:347 (+),score=132.00 TRINITY_DN27596_c0_g1_i1:126-1166(+)